MAKREQTDGEYDGEADCAEDDHSDTHRCRR
jgi:hypothetical protein